MGDWQATALFMVAVRLAPRSQGSASSDGDIPRRGSHRVAELGFADVCVYLADRVLERGVAADWGGR